MPDKVKVDTSLQERGSWGKPGDAWSDDGDDQKTATYDELSNASYDDEDFDDYLKSRSEPDDEDDDWLYR